MTPEDLTCAHLDKLPCICQCKVCLVPYWSDEDVEVRSGRVVRQHASNLGVGGKNLMMKSRHAFRAWAETNSAGAHDFEMYIRQTTTSGSLAESLKRQSAICRPLRHRI